MIDVSLPGVGGGLMAFRNEFLAFWVTGSTWLREKG